MGSRNHLEFKDTAKFIMGLQTTWLHCGEIGYVVALILPTQLFSLVNAVPPIDFQLWLVAIPVLIAFLVVLFIGAWIGWTMATTPPPRPLEEIEAEEKAEEEKKD
jgi:hypothetical protein